MESTKTQAVWNDEVADFIRKNLKIEAKQIYRAGGRNTFRVELKLGKETVSYTDIQVNRK